MPSLIDRAAGAAQSAFEAGQNLFRPTLRLGVTGLARSGKTVFTTALVHHLVRGTPLPAFRPAAEGRIRRARLAHQPDDDVPRFAFEANLDALVARRLWPGSTTRISELRLDIDYERASRWRSGPARLTLDIVDYPGEWLLDLALLDADYATGRARRVAASRRPDRAPAGRALASRTCAGRDPAGAGRRGRAAERRGRGLPRLPRRPCGPNPRVVATTPPGRFLMPGDLAGSPALTFAPLDLPAGRGDRAGHARGADGAALREPTRRRSSARSSASISSASTGRSCWSTCWRRSMPARRALAELEEALDRVLARLQRGPQHAAVAPVRAARRPRALRGHQGRPHPPHRATTGWSGCCAILVGRAVRRTEAAGARVGTVALASVRATRETTVRDGRETLRAVAGTPEAGERIGDEVFDGATEAAIFPGELPADPKAVLDGARRAGLAALPALPAAR